MNIKTTNIFSVKPAYSSACLAKWEEISQYAEHLALTTESQVFRANSWNTTNDISLVS